MAPFMTQFGELRKIANTRATGSLRLGAAELTVSDRSQCFSFVLNSWYISRMLHAYVGIASRQGLESLHPEEEHTTAFLLRRASRRRTHGVICFWAVISPELATQVQHTLSAGYRADAWLLLESLAFELGRILPESVDTVAAKIE